MYQKSRIILILLVFMFSAITIPCVAITIIQIRASQIGELESQQQIPEELIQQISEEFVLSGHYVCGSPMYGYDLLLIVVTWILGTVWEVLTLCLAVWIAIKHFRELPTGWTIKDCFTVLIRSHVLYFAS